MRASLPIQRWTLPVLVGAALLAGYTLRRPFTRPTTVTEFKEGPGARAVFTVEGLRCKGTARFFTRLYAEVPGVHAITTFAGEREAVFTYDPALVTPDRLRAIMEAPIAFDDGTTQQVFRCRSAR